MPTLGDLLVKVGADLSGFRGAMGDVADEAARGMGKVEREFRAFDKIANNLKSVGVTMTAAITAPLVGIGAIATKEFNAFELAMRQVTSLMGKEGNASFKQLSDQTLELSKRMGIDAVKASQALYEAISAGVPKENAMTFLEIASKTAIAGVTDTKVAVDGLTSVMNAYQLEASQTTEVSDAMFQAVNIGKFTFAELAATMSTAIPLASSLGIGFKEVLGAAASLTAQGFKISEAMTSIQSAMKGIISPNKEMNALLEKTGFATGQALINAKGFHGALNAIRDAAGGSVQKLTDAFGRVEALGAALKLTGEFSQTASRHIASVVNSTGAMGDAFNQVEQSSSRALERMSARFDVLKIQAGEQLKQAFSGIAEMLETIINAAMKAVEWFSQLPAPVKTAALAFAAVAAAAGPMLFAIGKSIELFRDFAKAGSGISTVISSMTNLSTVMGAGGLLGSATALVPVLAAVGAAIAGWAVFKAVGQLQELDKKLDDTFTKFEQFQKAGRSLEVGDFLANELEKGRKAGEKFADTIARLKKEAPDMLHGYAMAAKNAEDPWNKLNVTIAKTGPMAKATAADLEKAAEMAKKAAAAVEKTFSTFGLTDYQKKLADIRAEFPKLEKLYEQGRISAKQFEDAQKALAKATFEATSGGSAAAQEKFIAGFKKMQEQTEKMKAKFDEFWRVSIPAFAEAWDKAAAKDAWTDTIKALGIADETLKNFTMSAERSAEIMKRVTDQKAVVGLADAFKDLGIQSSAALTEAANKAKANFEKIQAAAKVGEASARDVAAAWVKAAEAALAAGEKLSAEDTKRLIKLRGEIEITGKVTGEALKRLSSQISTILTDMGKGFADAILHSKNLGEVFTKTAIAIKEAIVRWIIEEGTKKLLNEIKAMDFSFGQLGKNIAGIAKDIGDFFKGLSGQAGKAAKEIAAVGSSGADAIGGIAGSAGGAAGTAGGGATGAATSTGLMGALGPVGAIASAINAGFSAWQTFIQRRMEKDIGRIEVTTRGILNQLISIQEDINKYWPMLLELSWLQAIHGALIQLQDIISGGFASVVKTATEQVAETVDAIAEVAENVADLVEENISGAIENVGIATAEVADAVEVGSGDIVIAVDNAADQISSAVGNSVEEMIRASDAIVAAARGGYAPIGSAALTKLLGGISADTTGPFGTATIHDWTELPPWTFPQNYQGSFAETNPLMPPGPADWLQPWQIPQNFEGWLSMGAPLNPTGGLIDWSKPASSIPQGSAELVLDHMPPPLSSGMASVDSGPSSGNQIQINLYVQTADERVMARRIVKALSAEGIRV